MIRYFAQGRFGPWYEVEEEQWSAFGLWPISPGAANWEVWDEIDGIHRAVYVNTSTALREDIKSVFVGLVDLIWFPDMRCGDCNARLVDENAYNPDLRYPKYVHATATMHRHGAWPVERWDD